MPKGNLTAFPDGLGARMPILPAYILACPNRIDIG